MAMIRWGIIGPGAIARNFADGLKESASGKLCAVASTSLARRTTFGDIYRIPPSMRFDSYSALMNDEGVDAVYISTPHVSHAQLAIDALRAGKAVLCEKPGGLNAAELNAVVEVASQENRFFMEGLMYRAHPQLARVFEIMESGRIGDVRHISASFGFSAAMDPESRLFDPSLAGGAILDVGIYPVSFVRLIAGAAKGKSPTDPIGFAGLGVLGQTGVDEVARANLLFDGGVTADVSTAITMDMDNDALITGTKGSIRLLDPWTPGRNEGPSDALIEITVDKTVTTEVVHDDRMLFAFEAEAASKAIALGETQGRYPLPNFADSLGTMRVLDKWRRQVGYQLPGDTVAGIRRLSNTLPNGLTAMTTRKIDGLDRDISKFIIGCDNQENLEAGTIVWDAWIEAGGNTFDTGFVYGAGRCEEVFGQWIKARGVAPDINVIVKGGHSPYCTPRAMEAQFEISLDRLGLDHAPIYIMHRDNLDVPIDEFVDLMNRFKTKGLVGVFGGSNWTIKRVAEFNSTATGLSQHGMSILNNNLSLATMERPVWPGCLSSNTPETLEFLRKTNIAHMSWSSQARGFFVDPEDRTKLPDDTAPDRCFSSAANEERRSRAKRLATERGVKTHHISAAFVLCQSFPSFALVGTRTPNEIATTLPALDVELTANEVAWLNLETDELKQRS